MAENNKTVIELGSVIKNRGEYSSSAKYYKDNVVQYQNSAYIVSSVPLVGYLQNVVPTTPNSGWEIFAYGAADVIAKTPRVDVSQSFTDAEKKQVRANIGLGNGDIDDEPTAGSRNLITSGGIPFNIEDSLENFDLIISDYLGYILAKFYNGHLKVKNFDSKDVISDILSILQNTGISNIPNFNEEVPYSSGDKVKHNKLVYEFIVDHTPGVWNEEEVVQSDILSTFVQKYITGDFGISDEEGNVLLKLSNGNIQTKNFNSSIFVKDVSSLTTALVNGGHIIVAPGEYKIDAPLIVNSNTRLVGVRGGTKFILRNAETALIVSPGSQDIHISDITFIGKHPITSRVSPIPAVQDMGSTNGNGVYTDVGILIDGTRNSGRFDVDISHCKFENFGYAGIKMVYTIFGTSSTNYWKTPSVSECRFYNNWYGIFLGSRTEWVSIVGCNFNFNQIGLFYYGSNNPVSSSLFVQNYLAGIIVAGGGGNSAHGTITNCEMAHNGLNQGYSPNPTTFDVVALNVYFIRISNCIMGYDGLVSYNSTGVCVCNCASSGPIYIQSPAINGWGMIQGCSFITHSGLPYGNAINGDTTYIKCSNNIWVNATDNSNINN